MAVIKNINDLGKIVQPFLIKALELTRDELSEILDEKVDAYYEETPVNGWGDPPYERTYKLRDASKEKNMYIQSNTIVFTVGFKNEYLEYIYPGWEQRFKRGRAGKNSVTGYEVLSEQFNDSMHGNPNFLGRHNYWDEFIQEVSSIGIDNIFRKNCKKVGLSIK